MARRAPSVAVSALSGRSEASRVKSTSVGIWRREDVRLNRFSGARGGKARTKRAKEMVVRIVRARKADPGSGRIGWFAALDEARRLR